MTNATESRYPDLDLTKAVTFRIAFVPMCYSYGYMGWDLFFKKNALDAIEKYSIGI